MKQGRSSVETMKGTKVEPKAHAISVERTSQLGISTPFLKTELYKGRGLEAPMKGKTVHHCGSQGKH